LGKIPPIKKKKISQQITNETQIAAVLIIIWIGLQLHKACSNKSHQPLAVWRTAPPFFLKRNWMTLNYKNQTNQENEIFDRRCYVCKLVSHVCILIRFVCEALYGPSIRRPSKMTSRLDEKRCHQFLLYFMVHFLEKRDFFLLMMHCHRS